jgi:hypothetical protein
MKKKQIIIAIIVLVIVAGISFYSGYKVGQNSTSARGTRSGQALGPNGAGGMMGGANGIRNGRPGQGGAMTLVSGEVLSKDATSVTLKLRDGGSKIIFVATSTAVQKTVSGTVADLVIGNQITASGPANADGSINAVTINQRPAMPVLQGAGAGAPAGMGAGVPQGARK